MDITSQDFHENTKILPRFSGYAKEHPTSHKSSVSENLPEENPEYQIPSIKTNTEHSHLRENILIHFKKNTRIDQSIISQQDSRLSSELMNDGFSNVSTTVRHLIPKLSISFRRGILLSVSD